MRKAILFSILFLINLNAFAQTGITLRGTLKDDKGQPVANTQISVRGDAFSNTKSDGQFAIGLTNQVLPGQTVTLRVSKDRWIINDPVDGKWNVPSARFFAEQTLPVTIVPYGSLALLSPARLNDHISRIKDELTRKLNEVRQQNRSLAAREADNKAEIAALKQQVMTDLLRQWETDYGLTVAKMEEVISQYARTVNPKDDDRTKGLKAFQNGDYDRAADYFEKAALQDEDDIARKEAELELERLSAFKNWRDKGDAHSNLQKYELAIAAYDRAARYVTIERRPQEWASLQINRGIARGEFGIRTEPITAQRLLTEAVQAFRQSLAVYTREQLPRDWAMTQNNLGAALHEQAARAEGAEAARLYAEAVQTYRQALTVYTREQLPQDWAMTQNNLGIALRHQAARVEGAESARLYAEAVQAYRQALTVYTREQLPQDWAMTQNNLGIVLRNQAARAEGAEGARLYTEAVQAYRQALTIRTREQLPQNWAMTQNNLGIALRDQAARAEGAEGTRLYTEAVQAFRQSLTVFTSEQLPQQWAATQNNLGNALRNQAARAEGAERARLYAEAEQAYRQALTIRTREQLPQDWAMTQNNLGVVLRYQAASLGGEQGARLAREAIQAFETALQIRERATLPLDWLQTQNNLAETYYLIKDWPKAAAAYDKVLSMGTNYKQGLSRLSGIYHEQLFRLADAFAINERRVKLDSADLSAQCDWAETHFTTARFAEAETRLAALIANPKIRPSTQTALRVIEIANALALGKAESVKPKLAALIAAVTLQPADFRVGWSFNGTLHFIGTHEPLATRRNWLRQLITALQGENRDAILIALRSAQQQFRER